MKSCFPSISEGGNELYDVARRIATVGYYVLLPDLYHRQGKVRHAFYDEKGKMISLVTLSDELRAKVRAPLMKTSDAMVMEDTGALLEWIGRGEPVRPGAMGCIGYCLGGRMVFRACGTYPERFRAGASLHGTMLATDAQDSPHLTAARCKGELYCGYAEKDPNATPAVMNAVAAAMRGSATDYRPQLHKGAEHGYALPDRDIFDRDAANRDWERIFAMFHRQMGPWVPK